MTYLNFKSNYNLNPILKIDNNNKKLFKGFVEIIKELKQIKKGIIAFETYPAVDLDILYDKIIKQLNPSKVVLIEDYAKDEKTLQKMLEKNITDDRVFGLMSHHIIEDFYHLDKVQELKKNLKKEEGVKIVFGFGAHLVDADVIIPVSITRWEIQLRYRKGIPNFKTNNHDEDILRKYKRGYFVEWRVADRIKEKVYGKSKYIIDFNDLNEPVMINRQTFFHALKQLTKRPIRMVPYFDPGVWGGQWMKEVCNLDKNVINYAWSFDGVPEENSIKLGFGNKTIELPAQDIIMFEPEAFMGTVVHSWFGKKYPIRFDLLDTMGGGNLSLQVHPRTEYIYDKFGMTYTQDESYYILDTEDDGVIYLGFKNDVDVEAFKNDLLRAEKGEIVFDANKYVNTFKAKKHDHFLIPAGVIHCSGKNTMVLEISTTAYIFTFKLWDWGRVNLDGKPRPVHLEHGFNNLQYHYNEDFAKNELINQIIKIDDNKEITGLHKREFIKTTRYTFDEPYEVFIKDNVMSANLVSGEKAKIYSKDNSFEPLTINYAETFIVPAGVESFIIEPYQRGKKHIIITAQVKNG